MTDPLNDTATVSCPTCGSKIVTPVPDGRSTEVVRLAGECGHWLVFRLKSDGSVEDVRTTGSA